jgi:low temperature requirement protein LtrA
MSGVPPERAEEPRARRLTATLREGERVTPLELFFDLVFVLALTQCTTLMAAKPTWLGLFEGLLVLAVLWWSWCGYAWLTSVVDPEEGAVRIAMFAAMAAFLVAALCVPGTFDGDALLFAGAYGAVRVAHIALFRIASREDADLRASVTGLAISTAIGVALLAGGALAGHGAPRLTLWSLAIALDVGGPLLFGAEGWKLAPGHFAERHGLIVIIALGESVVSIGVGAHEHVDAGIVVGAVLGVVVAAALWWIYFDVTALVAERVLARAPAGRVRNEMARDSYSLLHFPMVAGIALLAVGIKLTLGAAGDPLALVPASALLGGVALYLLAHVAFRLRNVHTLSVRRLLAALVALALIPLATAIASLATLALLAVLLAALIAYEAIRYAGARERVRHGGATSRSDASG